MHSALQSKGLLYIHDAYISVHVVSVMKSFEPRGLANDFLCKACRSGPVAGTVHIIWWFEVYLRATWSVDFSSAISFECNLWLNFFLTISSIRIKFSYLSESSEFSGNWIPWAVIERERLRCTFNKFTALSSPPPGRRIRSPRSSTPPPLVLGSGRIPENRSLIYFLVKLGRIIYLLSRESSTGEMSTGWEVRGTWGGGGEGCRDEDSPAENQIPRVICEGP